jgi:hypothetical protein
MDRAALPIAVDLDGTLIRSDLLLVCASQFVRDTPLQAPRMAAWLLRGKAHLKARLAERVSIDGRTLPWHEELLAWLRERKREGRQFVLATASHRSVALQAIDHLRLFDDVLATEGKVNLKAEVKRDALVGRFGEGGFEYVGNEWADMPVWRCAAAAHVVTRSAKLARAVQALHKPGLRFFP